MPDADNKQLALDAMNAVANRDLDRLLALTDPDVVWRSFFSLEQSGEYRGHDELRRYFADIEESFSDLRPDLDDFLAVGDLVVGVGRVVYRGKASGVELTSPAGWVFKMRAGRVVMFRAFRDPEEALEVVGIPR